MPVHVAAAYAGPVTVMSLVVETGRQIEGEMLDAGADPEATARAAAARILDDASKQGTPAELAKKRLPDEESWRVRKVLVEGAWDDAEEMDVEEADDDDDSDDDGKSKKRKSKSKGKKQVANQQKAENKKKAVTKFFADM